MADFEQQRREMVETQLVSRGIKDPAVLDAMRTVPREDFVPETYRPRAYDDGALPIEAGETISQPYVVAWMIEALDVGSTSSVLEIGSGSGYAAAVLSRIAGTVYGVEIHPTLAELSRARLAKLGYDNVHIRAGDGSLGDPEHAPFDAILVSAGAPEVPDGLVDQLVPEGRLVIPVGAMGDQQLVRIVHRPDGDEREFLGYVAFVPLVGERGWPMHHGAEDD